MSRGTQVTGVKVLVAGASIAGPALAHWLRRRGAEVTVVERSPELRPGGQAVDARGVTKEVILRMGLDAAVRAARTETAGAHTVDLDGNVLQTYRACATTAPGTVPSTSSATGSPCSPRTRTGSTWPSRAATGGASTWWSGRMACTRR